MSVIEVLELDLSWRGGREVAVVVDEEARAFWRLEADVEVERVEVDEEEEEAVDEEKDDGSEVDVIECEAISVTPR